MGHKDEDECPPNAVDNNLFRAFVNALAATVDAPVTWFRGTCFAVCVLLCKLAHSLICFLVAESVVVPNQKKYPWYHQQFRRVPTIDQCYTDDVVCDFEANSQFKRDRLVLCF